MLTRRCPDFVLPIEKAIYSFADIFVKTLSDSVKTVSEGVKTLFRQCKDTNIRAKMLAGGEQARIYLVKRLSTVSRRLRKVVRCFYL
jgi:hypothetical protein